jgi:hypothetical protein
MWLFPTRHFKWHEPVDFIRRLHATEAASVRWWHRAFVMLGCTFFFLLSWQIAHMNPKNQPPPFLDALVLAASGGVFLVYLVPMLNRSQKSWITCFDDNILRMQGSRHRVWYYSQIVRFEVVDEEDYHILVLTLPRDQQSSIGIPRAISIRELEIFLSSRGVKRES